MYIEWLFFFIPIWVVSTAYVIYFDYKTGEFYIQNIIFAIIMGPIATLLIIDYKRKTKKHTQELQENERESNDRHRGWFRTMSEINKQRMTSFGRSISPPPPISRIERARTERDVAIRTARERIEPPNRRPNKTKDSKFFH